MKIKKVFIEDGQKINKWLKISKRAEEFTSFFFSII